ncbi:AAA family ATPase [bacterium]|nr:AAA family ATPase [bacterium]
MEYYELFGLKREPFSLSPDPDFFYHSLHYTECLQRLEISIRLRRGLNLILGDMGTGKTTISRILINRFKNEKDRFLFFLILDPSYNSEFQFLSALLRLFDIKPKRRSSLDYKEALQDFLFTKGVQEGKVIVLLVDEGQKLGSIQIEILRSLLNYETNEYKLLQLVILAQLEFLNLIVEHKNFLDRVNFNYTIRPLTLEEAKSLIEYRLQKAGQPEGKSLFADEAIRLIHLHTKGYPRKIIKLCHHSLISMYARGKQCVDIGIVQSLQENQVVLDSDLFALKRNLQQFGRRCSRPWAQAGIK